jgi:predicted ester cyclase
MSENEVDPVQAVTAYLEAIALQDWETVASALADDVVRVGPYGDVFTPKTAYLDFLVALMPTLPGYAMHIERVAGAGSVVVAQLAETITVDGAPLVTSEALVFDLDTAGRIVKIGIYLQRSVQAPNDAV